MTLSNPVCSIGERMASPMAKAFEGCLCANLGFSIGYEFHRYMGMPDFLEYTGESNGLNHNFNLHLQSLGFDDLFVRASLGF